MDILLEATFLDELSGAGGALATCDHLSDHVSADDVDEDAEGLSHLFALGFMKSPGGPAYGAAGAREWASDAGKTWRATHPVHGGLARRRPPLRGRLRPSGVLPAVEAQPQQPCNFPWTSGIGSAVTSCVSSRATSTSGSSTRF